MPCLHVLFPIRKHLFGRLFIVKKVPFDSGGHSEVVDEQGVLINVFKNAEFAFGERQFESVLEVVVWVESLFFFVFLTLNSDCLNLHVWLHHFLYIRSVETTKVLVFPVQFVE